MTIPNYHLWVRKDGGDWNADPTADPATGVGGIDFSPVIPNLVAPIVQGSDTSQTCNFGQNPFAYSVPSGFMPGWPAAGGGWTTLSPSKLYGSASLFDGNLTSFNGTTYGFAQSADAYDAGAFYFEVTCNSASFFTDYSGGGVGRVYPGINPNFWAISGVGGYGSGNPNGGAVAVRGVWPANLMALGACGSVLVPSAFTYDSGVISFAVFLAPPPAPGIPDPFCGDLHTASGFSAAWTPTGFPADTFTLQYRRVGTPTFTTVSGIVGTSHFITGLPPATPYEFQVKAVNAGGESDYSTLATCSTGNNLLEMPIAPMQRWRGQVGINWLGMALVGDAFSNVVGLSNFDAFTEYGQPMRFVVTSPPLHEDRKRVFVSRLEIEVEAGQGLPGEIERAPYIMLDVSKDGGKTWMPLQRWRSMGAVGEYIKRLRWLNLGQSRTWVFRFTCTDPVRRWIIGTYIDQYKGFG